MSQLFLEEAREMAKHFKIDVSPEHMLVAPSVENGRLCPV